MHRYRARYHRKQHGRTGQRLFLTLLAALYFAGAVSLGISISSRWLVPFTDTRSASEESRYIDMPSADTAQKPLDVLPAQEEEQTEKQIELKALSVYAVEEGSYPSVQEATERAQKIMSRGGAGYIYADRDASCHVLLCAYNSEDSAKKVAQRLLASGQADTDTLDLSTEPLKMTLYTGKTRAESILNSFDVFTKTMDGLDKIWRALDKGEMQSAEALVETGLYAEQLEEKRRLAFDGSLIEGDVQALEKWDECLARCAAHIRTIAGSDQSSMAVSAKIKYTCLAMAIQYRQYVKELSE